jgi:hypothetical protein
MHLRKLHVGFACLSPSNLPEMQAAIALVCTQRAAAADAANTNAADATAAAPSPATAAASPATAAVAGGAGSVASTESIDSSYIPYVPYAPRPQLAWQAQQRAADGSSSEGAASSGDGSTRIESGTLEGTVRRRGASDTCRACNI